MSLELPRLPPHQVTWTEAQIFVQKYGEAIEAQEATQDALIASLQTTDATVTVAQAALEATQSAQAQLILDLSDAVTDIATAQAAADTANATNATLDTRLVAVEGAAGNYVLKNQTAVWGLPTGTLTRTTFATYSATASVAYVQAELQAAMDHIKVLSETLAALVADLRTNDSLSE